MKRIKILRYIVIAVYFVLFGINVCLCLLLPNVHPISWILTGMILGFGIMSLMSNSILNMQDDFIDFLMGINKKYSKMITDLLDRIAKYRTTTKKLVKKKK